jgi:hypothetical protein
VAVQVFFILRHSMSGHKFSTLGCHRLLAALCLKNQHSYTLGGLRAKPRAGMTSNSELKGKTNSKPCLQPLFQ